MSAPSKTIDEIEQARQDHWELIAHTNFFLNSGRAYGDWLYPLCPPALISIIKGSGRQYYSDDEIAKMTTLDLYPIKQDMWMQERLDANPMNQPPRKYGRGKGNYASDRDQWGNSRQD